MRTHLLSRRTLLSATTAVLALPTSSIAPAQGTMLSFARLGGSPRKSGAANRSLFTAAIDCLGRAGGGSLRIEPGIYPFDGEASITASNVTVLASGAVFEGPNARISIRDGCRGISLEGLRIIETSGSSEAFLLNIAGSGCRLRDVHLEKRPEAGGYIAYCQQNSAGNLFENFSFAGSNGVFMGGCDHQVIGGWAKAAGGDDCWVLKSTTHPCSNIRIVGFRAEGFAALLSIGSEVGRRADVHPAGPVYVRGVLLENCIAERCSTLAYIKPGGVAPGRPESDWRNGLVEDVTIRNCRCEDPEGKFFRCGVYVSPARGATVRKLVVDNLRVRARGKAPAVQSIAAVYLRILPMRGDGGRGGTIDEVTITGLRSIDPYGGMAEGPGRPGMPIQHAVVIEKENADTGRIGRVDVVGAVAEGMARSAVVVGRNIDGPVAVRQSQFRNFAAGILASYDRQAILNASPVTVESTTATPSPWAPPGTPALR